MKFSDFDFEQHTVSVRRQLGANPVMEGRSSKIASYSVIEKDPKTFNSVRTLRIPQVIETEVLRRKNKIDEDRAALMDGHTGGGIRGGMGIFVIHK